MPITLNTSFKLTALRPNGTGVAGAQLRILTNAGDDVTAQLFGSAQLYTDASGVWAGRETGFIGDALLSTQATVQVIASQYETWSIQYPFSVLGIAHLTANLVRISTVGSYTVTAPSADFLSSMVPILFVVESANSFEWEYIRARVERSDGSVSVIEAPVDKSTHLASLDIRNRISLGVRPFLVKEPDVSRPDTDFSDKVTVTFTSLTAEGEAAIDGEFLLSVAATLPPDGETDLSSYVAENGREWIVPSLPVIAALGYYHDVMIWLPSDESAGFTLTSKYYSSGGSLLSTVTADLTDSIYVQRIRLNTDPPVGTARCVLSISQGSTVITQPLTVRYRD